LKAAATRMCSKPKMCKRDTCPFKHPMKGEKPEKKGKEARKVRYSPVGSGTDSDYASETDDYEERKSESMGPAKYRPMTVDEHSMVGIVYWDDVEYSGCFVRGNQIWFGDHFESDRPKKVKFFFPIQDATIELIDSGYLKDGSSNAKVKELKDYDPTHENRMWTYECPQILNSHGIKGVKFSKVVPPTGTAVRSVVHWSSPAKGGSGRMTTSMTGDVTGVSKKTARGGDMRPEGFPVRMMYDIPTTVGVCFTPIFDERTRQVYAIHVAGDGGKGRSNEGLTVAGFQ